MENQEFILIGMPCGSGSVPAPMVQSLLQLHKPMPCAFMVVERQMIDTARNGIVLEALQKGASYLLFLDDDNPIPPDTLEKMIEDDKDIVIAPILTRNANKDGEHLLCAFYSQEIDGKRIYHNVREFRDVGDLHKIDGGGTGCMLIKTEVLAKLYSKYSGHLFERTRDIFDKPIMVDGKEYTERTMSEDVLFCERAIDAGFEVWLDSRIRPLHITGNQFIQWQHGK
jgi:glycosyltransferase involved in cell wall biosynthesis